MSHDAQLGLAFASQNGDEQPKLLVFGRKGEDECFFDECKQYQDIISEWQKKLIPNMLSDDSRRMFVDSDGFESITLALMSKSMKLNPHKDTLNDNRKGYDYTFALSQGVMIDDEYYRFTLIGYTRMWVGNYLDKLRRIKYCNAPIREEL